MFNQNKNAIKEIALREQQDFVDKIFLIESSITHKGVTLRQLWLWQCDLYLSFEDIEATSLGEIKMVWQIQFCGKDKSGPCCGRWRQQGSLADWSMVTYSTYL